MQPESITYLLWNDLAGVTRTRGVPTQDLAEKAETGLGWACAGQALTAFGTIVDNPWGPMDEARQIPDPNTAFRFEGTVMGEEWEAVLCDSKRGVDEDWDCCPRTFYRHALEDLERETGCTLMASFEHEFSVLTDQPRSDGFTLAAARRGNAFLRSCATLLRAAGVTPETLEPEYGASQYEICCAPARGLAAADGALVARELIRAAAEDHGLTVSFTPKPAPDAVGNGAHIHFSLIDRESGENVTHDPEGPMGLAPIMQQFCAGILAHLEALVAISAPTPVSYYRLKPHSWSCGFRAIGLQNREAALRVTPSPAPDPAGRRRGWNVEYRPADGAASPYLTLGVLVRAGLDGIRRGLPLPAPIECDPADMTAAARAEKGIVPLPVSLAAALDALEADEIVRGWFSPDLYSVYRALKLWEVELARAVTEDDLFARYRAAF